MGQVAWLRRGLNLSYPGMSPFRRLGKISHPPEPLISDVCAEAVDQAVSRVASSNREVGEALGCSYLLRQSYRKIATATGIGKTRVGTLVKLGEASVSEILDGE
jgi:hypothetical protein